MNRRIFKNKQSYLGAVIPKDGTVLDVGFSGQGKSALENDSPHHVLQHLAKKVYGLDLAINREHYPDTDTYQEGSAEDFSFPTVRFDAIFAGDVIEHLSNPGLFLTTCAAHLSPTGTLVLTTPNCFNLFNLFEKISKDEPTVNADHTLYFNHKTLCVLLNKCGYEVVAIDYIYSLEYTHKESWKKKLQNYLYKILSWFTPKYIETLAVVAIPKKS